MKFFSRKQNKGTPMPIKKRKKDIRGSITALVVLILVPTIVFEGFLVDLARMKLYGDQAIMVADNYGESVLTVYNNVLKDLYGLFAISSQNKDGSAELNGMEDFIASAFNPASNVIIFDHFTGAQNLTGTGQQARYHGFMPYKDAKVTLSYDEIDTSALSETDVLSTQIGDFMKFRVAQALMDSGSDVIEALDNIMSMEANSKVIDKKSDFDKEVENVIDKCRDFYNLAKKFNRYCVDHVYGGDGFLLQVVDERDNALDRIESIGTGPKMALYHEYLGKKSSIEAALARKKKLKIGESLSDADQELVDWYNEYLTSGADYDSLKSSMENVINAYSFSLRRDSNDIVDFYDYDAGANLLMRYADNVASAFDDLETATKKLQQTLNDPKVSTDMKTGIQADIDRINTLFKQGNTYSVDNFTKLADVIKGQSGSNGFNDTQRKAAENNITLMEKQMDAYLNGESVPTGLGAQITKISTNFNDFYKDSKLKALYDELTEMFKQTGDEDEGNSRKDDAENFTQNAESELKQDETSNARDIPKGITIGKNKEDEDFWEELAFTKLLKSALSIFDSNGVAEGANDLLLKLYTVIYDTSMFSCRTTNLDGNNDKNNNTTAQQKTLETTLTGYALCKEINYLYGAELEYLFGGYKDSDDNLAAARNKIVGFRAIVNFTASYTIGTVNSAIHAVADPVKAICAPVGIALDAALRVAFAMIETAADWSELKQGEGVVLIKESLDDLTTGDKIMELLPEMKEKPSGNTKKIKLDYETYVTIMLIAMTTDEDITKRTGDLISLNVSAVENNIGDSGTLTADTWTFKLAKAYTAINATCSVALDFVVLPMSMANMLLGGDTSTLDEIRNTGFKFTVTRSY